MPDMRIVLYKIVELFMFLLEDNMVMIKLEYFLHVKNSLFNKINGFLSLLYDTQDQVQLLLAMDSIYMSLGVILAKTKELELLNPIKMVIIIGSNYHISFIRV